jgi:hypothetical protein
VLLKARQRKKESKRTNRPAKVWNRCQDFDKAVDLLKKATAMAKIWRRALGGLSTTACGRKRPEIWDAINDYKKPLKLARRNGAHS